MEEEALGYHPSWTSLDPGPAEEEDILGGRDRWPPLAEEVYPYPMALGPPCARMSTWHVELLHLPKERGLDHHLMERGQAEKEEEALQRLHQQVLPQKTRKKKGVVADAAAEPASATSS